MKTNLSKTSLIHIFVVSGSHLILLDQLLSILRIPVFLRFLFLGGYSLAVGWQAPAVRAFLGLCLREFFRRKKHFFPADLVVLLTGLSVLFLFPAWWNSLSLQMSWCAALALGVPELLRLRGSMARILAAQFSIFLFMSAPLWGLGSLHPLGLLYNLFLAPVVSYVLLPLSFLAVLFKGLCLTFFDKVMTSFTFVLPLLAEPVQIVRGSPPSVGFLWLWILLWHLVFHFLRLHLWQGKDSTR
ncbi:ComEC/Rec2 family competence protein [Bdellovibrio sp. 22V]|uniref:ComEC/Rec2 family competence protein n=1 Tax=Bdellovibrio TaxID=958 RepID=UPI0032EF5AB5